MTATGSGGASEDVAALLRWEAAGGTWVATNLTGPSVTVELISCDGGQVVGRLSSSSPDFAALVRDRTEKPAGSR